MPTPTPLEVAQRKTPEPSGITGEEAQRWLEARRAPGLDWREAWLGLKKREIDYDATVIGALPARQYVSADGLQQAREQYANLEALGRQRRINALAQQGISVPDTSCGVQTLHPNLSPPVPVMTMSHREVNDGWLGT